LQEEQVGIRRTEESRNKDIRIALTSGLLLKQVAHDLGIGLSTLGKTVTGRQHDELMPGSHYDKGIVLARLLTENRTLCEERDIVQHQRLWNRLAALHKREFLVHRNDQKGNEDETEIADTTNERSQGNKGHRPATRK
jgi:transposase|tara:strand:+ start:67 stop:480 length:414 start_codon:yes stop_codon:yes gene_type:complete